MPPIIWKKGRGKLGAFQPIMGKWEAHTKGPEGNPIIVTRELAFTLNKKYIQMSVVWGIPNKPYEELSLIGVNDETGEINFWSFINNGNQHTGHWADVTDVHPQAFGFEAHMPAGLARMAYYPHEKEGFLWTVASRSKKGWNHFVEHHYKKVSE